MAVHEASSALSFVIPVHNEEESLRELHAQIVEVCRAERYSYEVIFVDDGSTDGSFRVIEELAGRDASVRAIQFRRNFGQTAALTAGIRATRHPLVVTLDADLQNDPHDLPRLLAKLAGGYDVISGWRRDRQDSAVRRWPSRCANRLISAITGVHLSDYGCTLKVYRREYVEDAPLYGEMHRFIPIFAAWNGAKVTEIPVTHHARKYGSSHYGLKRTGKVMLDLLTVKFLHTYIARPMHFFGAVGAWLIGIGAAGGAVALLLKALDIRDLVETPLMLVTVFLFIVGVQFILMGLLAEILIRIYFDQSGHSSYRVAQRIGGADDRPA